MKNKIIKCISLILSISLFSLAHVAFATKVSLFDNVSSDSEYGYIFTLKDASMSLFDTDVNSNIDIISAENNLFHADNIDDIAAFTNERNISHIAEDGKVTLHEYPYTTDDLLFNEQWQFEACSINSYWKNDINGAGVKIAIIDTGIKASHEEFLNAQIDTGINVCALLDNNQSNLYNTDDVYGHGSAVASIIAAEINNNAGIAGIVDKCSILPIKIYDTSSSYNLSISSVLMGLVYAESQGADVINLSLGFTETSPELGDIVNELVDNITAKGTLVIASTGNAGETTNVNTYPASCNNTIGVGALKLEDNEYMRAVYSTANDSIWVSAPGQEIYTVSISSNTSYTTKEGTSFSAPIVSAAAVGAKQVKPDLTVDEFKEILKNTSTDLDEPGYDYNTGYGMINFEGIVNALKEVETPTEPSTGIPTEEPTDVPTEKPTLTPTSEPTTTPTITSTITPTVAPTVTTTIEPTATPTALPTIEPTATPTIVPTNTPTVVPTIAPTETTEATNSPVPSEQVTIIPDVSETANPEPTETETAKPLITSLTIDEDAKLIRCEAINRTDTCIEATGFVAIYDTNGCLISLKIIQDYEPGISGLDVDLTELDLLHGKVSYFIWDNITTMLPYPESNISSSSF